MVYLHLVYESIAFLMVVGLPHLHHEAKNLDLQYFLAMNFFLHSMYQAQLYGVILYNQIHPHLVINLLYLLILADYQTIILSLLYHFINPFFFLRLNLPLFIKKNERWFKKQIIYLLNYLFIYFFLFIFYIFFFTD